MMNREEANSLRRNMEAKIRDSCEVEVGRRGELGVVT
jgi:hypothetical protein